VIGKVTVGRIDVRVVQIGPVDAALEIIDDNVRVTPPKKANMRCCTPINVASF
jgi:hypothetical protein